MSTAVEATAAIAPVAGTVASGQPAAGVAFDEAELVRRMRHADVADELFLPIEHSSWHGGRQRLERQDRARARTRITGVRLLAADLERRNLEPEREVQTDFRRLLQSLIRLREAPGCAALCLSGATFRTSPRGTVPRLRFGLCSGAAQGLADGPRAARQAYRTVRRAIRRAGFGVVEPRERFAQETGLEGLVAWTDRLLLRRRRAIAPWLLLLLLPLLALIPRCDAPASFFGAPIETRSFLLLVDRSGSMEPHFSALRAEAARVLGLLAAVGGSSGDVIAYDARAECALGGITPIDPVARQRIDAFLASLQPGGGTNLRAGLEFAARHVSAHGQPTTLIVLTDAEDSSIREMLDDSPVLRASFHGVETHTYALTPTFFAQPGALVPSAQPGSQAERDLAALAELLGGRFGPADAR
ncbi:MAG: VWA domain-containing protein [Planctomycetes bacterium]|nr:VWA domain-containing protein [Planctomycetota bacterium]